MGGRRLRWKGERGLGIWRGGSLRRGAGLLEVGGVVGGFGVVFVVVAAAAAAAAAVFGGRSTILDRC